MLNRKPTPVFSDELGFETEDGGEVGHELFEVQYFMSALRGKKSASAQMAKPLPIDF